MFAGHDRHRPHAPTRAELLGYLCRCENIPDGAVLSTGTGIVPDLEFTLLDGDVVRSVEEVGALVNPVVTVEVARSLVPADVAGSR